jgi:dTDP-4-amino-4,6-dideoxygalactose transaminase
MARQIRGIARRAIGRSLTPPSFAAMTLDADDVDLARDWLARPDSWNGTEEIDRFQSAFAGWNGSAHAFSFLGGRVALSAAIDALGLQEGDEVVLPGYTCVVVANAFHFAGVRTVFCDIELETFGPDIHSVEERITSSTRAIMVQHLYGLVCRDYETIIELAKRKGIPIIEDCAQATGAELNGRKVGNLGDVAFYSTEQTKVLNTIQGGLVTTNRHDLAERLHDHQMEARLPGRAWTDRQLKNVVLSYYSYKHPRRWLLRDLYDLKMGDQRMVSTTPLEERGERPAHYGMRMPAPVASIGLNQLAKVNAYNEARREAAAEWRVWCVKNGYEPPQVIPGSVPVFLRYPVIVEPEKKSDRLWAIKKLGFEPDVWFSSHLHPAPKSVSGCPNADRAVAGCINFPTLR